MKRMKLSLFVLATLLALFLVTQNAALPGRVNAASPAKRYVAAYHGNPDDVADAVAAAGGVLVANHHQIGIVIADSDDPGFAAAVAANPGFDNVTEDVEVQWLPPVESALADEQLSSAPDPVAAASPFGASFLSLQWNIFVTQTNQAWNITQGSAAVKVAVLDTGICAHHIDTSGKVDVAESASFVSDTGPCGTGLPAPNCPTCPAWEDYQFHGTHVAATISSNNLGTAGIAPNVRLRAIKVLRCTGSGPFSAIINGIMYATLTGNDVINMSLGAVFPKNGGAGPGSLGQLVAAVNKAVNFAQTQGVLVVSAAGNNGIDLDQDGNLTSVPCQSGSGMCVGATTRNDALATYSNHGVSGPQITAPGGGDPVAPFPATSANRFILGPCSRHSVLIPVCTSGSFRYLFVAGTSQATPHVSGAAALVDSVAPAGPGSYRSSQLRARLLQGADDLGKPGTDNIYSRGRLNTRAAVQ